MGVASEYVEERNGGLLIQGTRVSLDSVVYAFRNGDSPETIARSFPLLTLEQVYGAITYYLSHREEVDAYLDAARADYERKREEAQAAEPEFYRKLRAGRSTHTAR